MKVWRLAKEKHAIPNGEGAKKYGGRWNPPGIPVVYTSESLALAALQALVHVDSDLFPDDLIVFSANIPDTLTIQSLSEKELPFNWNSYPPPTSLQSIVVEWIRTNTTVGLRLPSAIIPHEYNILLNPTHQDFPQIHWEHIGPFQWDPRLEKDR